MAAYRFRRLYWDSYKNIPTASLRSLSGTVSQLWELVIRSVYLICFFLFCCIRRQLAGELSAYAFRSLFAKGLHGLEGIFEFFFGVQEGRFIYVVLSTISDTFFVHL